MKTQMDANSLDMFKTEMVLMRSLDHPNIVKFLDYFEDTKRYYIVTELCHGGELFQTIEKYLKTGQVFDERNASHIIRDLSSVIYYLGKNEINHLDLKPENILFSSLKEMSIKIIDFHRA